MGIFCRVIVFVALLAVVGCSALRTAPKKDEPAPSPFGPTGIPPALRGDAATPKVTLEGGQPASEVGVALASHPSAENIMWTNPDDDGEQLPELQRLLAEPTREPWEKNEEAAKQRAMREGKCLMIWFTDSVRSPMCKALSEELFGRKEFGEWAKQNVVRFIVDLQVTQASGEKLGDAVDAAKQATDLKKRYKALGTPVVVMLSPLGETLAQYRGYKHGDHENFWGKLKYSVQVGNNQYTEWAKKMEQRGFRSWADRTGRKVLAKLLSYRQGRLLLTEPDGNRFVTDETKLSDADQAWVLAERKKRGL